MDRDGRYGRWARRVVARGHGVGSALEAGAVLRVLGTPETLEARLETLAATGEAATAFEAPAPLQREGLGAAEPLEALRARLEREQGRVGAATAWLEAGGFWYDSEDDALKWRTGGRPRYVVSIAAAQVWRLYYQQQREEWSYAQGVPLPHDGDALVDDVDPAVLMRVRWALSGRFPAHLLSEDRVRKAIHNHGRDTSAPNLVDLPRLP